MARQELRPGFAQDVRRGHRDVVHAQRLQQAHVPALLPARHEPPRVHESLVRRRDDGRAVERQRRNGGRDGSGDVVGGDVVGALVARRGADADGLLL